MTHQRWLRIIPVALIMYTISYVDRTNISLALDPKLSGMMRDLLMNDRMKGQAAGIFFLGYVLLQIPGGYLAGRWSPKKLISLFLVFWGICAVGCGLVSSFREFAVMRFMLGMAESGVYPTMLVMLANWFPRSERARANAYWNLCQPLAVAASAPVTGLLLVAYGWQTMFILEGALPFLWLPVWLYAIRDHPRDAKWISRDEKDFLETTLQREARELEPAKKIPLGRAFLRPAVLTMLAVCFLYNFASYGCNTFLTEGIRGGGHNFTGLEIGLLFAVPYVVTAVVMVLLSRHSDRTGERRGHAAFIYAVSGTTLIASVLLKEHSFWLSYAFLCLAIPGPFAGLAPFFAIPTETMPRATAGAVIGLVNALGNVGGYLGPTIVGILKSRTHEIAVPFVVLGGALLAAAALCFLLPKAARQNQSPSAMPKV
ncbi:MAG TPA: MFS transporter [Verrucomicrobiae bacterium]|nr:MFS transporter [Verrucomicrobiae bacterium]